MVGSCEEVNGLIYWKRVLVILWLLVWVLYEWVSLIVFVR